MGSMNLDRFNGAEPEDSEEPLFFVGDYEPIEFEESRMQWLKDREMLPPPNLAEAKPPE